MGGCEAGIVFEGDRRFNIVVRLPNAVRNDLDAVGAISVLLPGEGNHTTIRLAAVARFGLSEGINQVSRDNGKRRVVLQANVRGSDLGIFVNAARAMRGMTMPRVDTRGIAMPDIATHPPASVAPS